MAAVAPPIPITQPEWRKALADLPDVLIGGKLPAFFFAHGRYGIEPMLAYPQSLLDQMDPARAQGAKRVGPHGPMAMFLRDFGPFLLGKYKPNAILVLSAHWETEKQRLVTDYGDENPLLMDYFGFPDPLYQLKFKSRGNSALTARIVECLKKAGIPARSTLTSESRGQDGCGYSAPGLDHGVFVPFKLMFGDEFMDIPVVQVSIDGSLSPYKNWKLGEALDPLRSEGVLILSGGLTNHGFEEGSGWEETAPQVFKDFSNAVSHAVQIQNPDDRSKALFSLTSHPGFRRAHPREEHFIPIYVAAGAGGMGKSKLLAGLYGAHTVAFGIE